jgi:hypothetical protein
MEESGDWIDWFEAYYRLDGGSLVQFADEAGDISGGSATYDVTGIGTSGQSLEVVLRAKISGSESYQVDEVRVTDAASPAATSAQPQQSPVQEASLFSSQPMTSLEEDALQLFA